MATGVNMKELKPGTKVTYLDEAGKKGRGVVHAVNKHEDAEGNVRGLTYSIDTGKDERVDLFKRNPRGEAIGKIVEQYQAEGMATLDALNKAVKAPGLPEDKVVTEKLRHPVLVMIPAEFVEAV